jgi:FtsP/CotA-like multicopper oxidase with cupredoxin domain
MGKLILKIPVRRIGIFLSVLAIIFSAGLTNVNVMAMPASATDGTQVPHYFGPWPNWATSPLTKPNVQVVITGKGTGATAEASVGANGAITGITITNGGSGYTSPTIGIVGSGTGALAKATVVKKGAVVGVTLTSPGAGYTKPTVSFSGGGSGSGAAATAYGDVGQVTVTKGGLNYTFPTVDFDLPDGPDGVRARGHIATVTPDGFDGMDANGTIKANGVIVDNPGSGYSTAPKVFIRNGTQFDPVPGATPAVATTSLVLSSIVVDSSGAGYTKAPAVTINDPKGLGATATAALDNGVITAIDVTKPGSGYITSGGIRKFVDTLPGVPGLTSFGGANNLGQYMPLALPDTTTFSVSNGYAAGADYYVIALVQHREQMHSDLPPVVDPATGLRTGGTLLREYVQLMTLPPGTDCATAGGVPLMTDLLDGTSTPTTMPDGTTQACGYDYPHFLGPVIVANKDKAVRITFYNLLPTGGDGDLFLPVDSTFMGSGMVPDSPMMEGYDPIPTTGGTVMDPIRNPMCSESMHKGGEHCFVDNRATLHLHGGITPWISDGTPHQWITPANEATAWPEGVSVGNVPDMITAASIAAGVPDCSNPSDGCSTFYYTNQQSARLMFYHDHAWGITRLNVYAGEAAGYLITDSTEQALMNSGVIPALTDQIPLVIQDRTFVPDVTQLYDVDVNGLLPWEAGFDETQIVSYGQDPAWDKTRWGGKGSLWYEHVYMPAQNPSDPSGMSAYGRWMYGPWFWPPQNDVKYGPIDNPYFDPTCSLDVPATWQYDTDPFCEPALIPGTTNNSAGMEQFNDTPIVNGTAYPTVTLEPKTYRFRILNAANDRFWNLQWYVADPNTASTGVNGKGEVIGGTEVAFNAAELAAAQLDPNIFPTPDTSISPVGPSWVQIGTEGGFLPAPVVVPNQPITWIIDPTRFDVGNVDKHALLLAPAERADVVVDFSKYAGKTLILYNDAPAAFPARVSSYDYYTGAPDLSPVGAPTILPGYGPNTRTIMQVKIAASAPANAFNLAALNAAFRHNAGGTGVFESGQHPIIVGQAAYNSAYGTNFASGAWCNAPSNPSGKCDGYARISEQGGDLFKFDTLSGKKISIPLEPKAIHDEMNAATFDEFGRMTANLGVESVPSNPGGQNINLMPYVFPPTEVIDATKLPKNDISMTPIGGIAMADGTQIWKITHNGVDTHPIHWHLYDVQLLNRVTWDNIIIPPDASELGWKDTIRISPLEDTIVALRPIIPWLPFEIPNSVRELSPMMPAWNGIGTGGNVASLGDMGVLGSATISDALMLGVPPSGPNGEPIDVLNHIVNFGWEYVFHCHILSHEEMDMMHPVLVALPPVAPADLQFVDNLDGTATLSWTDNSISETAFVVEKSIDGGTAWTVEATIQRLFSDPLRAVLVDPLPAPKGEVITFTDNLYQAGDQYRVAALNTVGDTWDYANPGTNEIVSGGFPTVSAKSAYATVLDAPPLAAPSGLTATPDAIVPQITLSWTDNATSPAETGFVIERSDNGGPFTQIDLAPANSVSYVDLSVADSNLYAYQVAATDGVITTAFTNVAAVDWRATAPLAPTLLAADVVAANQVDLSWTDVATETSFVVERSLNGGAFAPIATLAADTVIFTDATVAVPNSYTYRVGAKNGAGTTYSNEMSVTVNVPVAPSNLSATNVFATGFTLHWNPYVVQPDGFEIQVATSQSFTSNLQTFPDVGADLTALDISGLSRNTRYYVRMRAINAIGPSAWSPMLNVKTTK